MGFSIDSLIRFSYISQTNKANDSGRALSQANGAFPQNCNNIRRCEILLWWQFQESRPLRLFLWMESVGVGLNTFIVLFRCFQNKLNLHFVKKIVDYRLYLQILCYFSQTLFCIFTIIFVYQTTCNVAWFFLYT